jgi:hypothetical protein
MSANALDYNENGNGNDNDNGNDNGNGNDNDMKFILPTKPFEKTSNKENWDDDSADEEVECNNEVVMAVVEKIQPNNIIDPFEDANYDYDDYDDEEEEDEEDDYDYDELDMYDKKMGRYVMAPVKKKK